MQSEFTFNDLLGEALDIESGDMTFFDAGTMSLDAGTMSLDMARVRLLGVHLLACSMVRREDVEPLLYAIDEPTIYAANDLAFKIFGSATGIISHRICAVLDLPEPNICGHSLAEGCWRCCNLCNYDRHLCRGCGKHLPHGQTACQECLDDSPSE